MVRLERPPEASAAASAFARLDSTPPLASAMLSNLADEHSAESAQRVVAEALSSSPALSPSQLALIAHSLPAAERFLVLEKTFVALRDANERLAHSAGAAAFVPPQDAAAAGEIAALKAQVASFQAEVMELRARDVERDAAKAWPSLSGPSRRKYLGDRLAARGRTEADQGGAAADAAAATTSGGGGAGGGSGGEHPHARVRAADPKSAHYLPSGFFDPWRGMPSSAYSASPPAAPLRSSFFVYSFPNDAGALAAHGNRTGVGGDGGKPPALGVHATSLSSLRHAPPSRASLGRPTQPSQPPQHQQHIPPPPSVSPGRRGGGGGGVGGTTHADSSLQMSRSTPALTAFPLRATDGGADALLPRSSTAVSGLRPGSRGGGGGGGGAAALSSGLRPPAGSATDGADSLVDTLTSTRLYSPAQQDARLSSGLGATTRRGGAADQGQHAAAAKEVVNLRQSAASATAVPQALGYQLQARGAAPVSKQNLSVF